MDRLGRIASQLRPQSCSATEVEGAHDPTTLSDDEFGGSKWAFFKGEIVPIREAQVSVMTAALQVRSVHAYFAWLRAPKGALVKIRIQIDVEQIYLKFHNASRVSVWSWRFRRHSSLLCEIHTNA